MTGTTHRTRTRDWFAPKRFGYGSGLPIAWQGWLVYAAYLAAIAGAGAVRGWWSLAIAVAATLLLIAICRGRTRGGWRWRSGAVD